MIIFLSAGILKERGLSKERIDELGEEIGSKIVLKERLTANDSEISEVEIIIGFGHRLFELDNDELLKKIKNLKWIHSLTAGVETLPLKKLLIKKIIVTSGKGIHSVQISEQILGTMISFSRGLYVNYKNKIKKRWDPSYPADVLSGKTLCIIGAGSIGKELARKANVFNMKIIGIKKNTKALEFFNQIEPLGNIKPILAESDYIVNLLPLTEDTLNLISYEEFSVMKPTAVFLNFSRGKVVNESALINALNTKKIRGAGLDVFFNEPLPSNNPLWEMENVLISPHNSGIFNDLQEKELELFKHNYYRYKEGLTLINALDYEKFY